MLRVQDGRDLARPEASTIPGAQESPKERSTLRNTHEDMKTDNETLGRVMMQQE